MVSTLTIAAAIALFAWLYLLLFRGGFWRADQFLAHDPPDLPSWPKVAAVIPARNEADVVERAVGSLIEQDYPGEFSITVVDDGSDDGTADAARLGAGDQFDRFRLVPGAPLKPGWTGKLWAVAQGLEAAPEDADYILLTDADIAHAPSALTQLVTKAETENLDLVSLMVKLHCQSLIERLLIPPFVFFFQMLYPFPWVNEPRRRTAGAAGGCMLVRKDALDRIGGVTAIKGALIDDCALAAAIKPGGAIWLGLTEQSHSLRPYAGIGDIWRMVARTAFTQLNHSALALVGTVIGMTILYLTPIAALIAGAVIQAPLLGLLGAGALAAPLLAYWPTWKLYRRISPAFFALPLAGVLYTAMTVDSARRHWLGAGGGWKDRTYDRSHDHDELA